MAAIRFALTGQRYPATDVCMPVKPDLNLAVFIALDRVLIDADQRDRLTIRNVWLAGFERRPKRLGPRDCPKMVAIALIEGCDPCARHNPWRMIRGFPPFSAKRWAMIEYRSDIERIEAVQQLQLFARMVDFSQ